jgi:hypothetical protein
MLSVSTTPLSANASPEVHRIWLGLYIYIYIQGEPDSIRQLPSIDNKRYFPTFPCVVGLIGY